MVNIWPIFKITFNSLLDKLCCIYFIFYVNCIKVFLKEIHIYLYIIQPVTMRLNCQMGFLCLQTGTHTSFPLRKTYAAFMAKELVCQLLGFFQAKFGSFNSWKSCSVSIDNILFLL